MTSIPEKIAALQIICAVLVTMVCFCFNMLGRLRNDVERLKFDAMVDRRNLADFLTLSRTREEL